MTSPKTSPVKRSQNQMTCLPCFLASQSNLMHGHCCSTQLHGDVTRKRHAPSPLSCLFSDLELPFHHHVGHVHKWDMPTHSVFLLPVQAWLCEGGNLPWDNVRSVPNKSTKFPSKMLIYPLQLWEFPICKQHKPMPRLIYGNTPNGAQPYTLWQADHTAPPLPERGSNFLLPELK